MNTRHPPSRLIMARLDERYGSPEAVEQALFCKLKSIPKVKMKFHTDSGILQTCCQRWKPLSKMDTSQACHTWTLLEGLIQIIEKLPHNIQEKWIYFGSKYKREHYIIFPPFSVLADFICTEAKACIDTSFNTQASMERKKKWERPVYVHKTQVSSIAEGGSPAWPNDS